MATGYIQR